MRSTSWRRPRGFTDWVNRYASEQYSSGDFVRNNALGLLLSAGATLGRLLRPKSGDNRAWFYTLVSHETCEQDYARNRRRFLAKQGYRYAITPAGELATRSVDAHG